jgi:acetyl-CoA acetyltransferase
MHDYRITEEQLAEFAVLMRTHAMAHPGAQFREPITVADVMASRSIATPLKLLDCCPVSDGGAAFVISRERVNDFGVRIMGAGQAHRHQHVTMAGDVARYGASDACERAVAASGAGLKDIDYVAIYDSFTITLAILLEEIGIANRGEAAQMAKSGEFGVKGRLPLNTHGGLLSYGHCGTGGAMAHVVETHLQMTGRAGPRQVPKASLALMHGDGGILSSHVSMFVERVR